MTARNLIVREAYLRDGIADVQTLADMAGLSRVRTQTVLKKVQEEVESGSAEFGFLTNFDSLSGEAGKVIVSQRRKFEEEESTLEGLMAEEKNGSRQWFIIQKRLMEIRSEIRKLSGASTLLEIARASGLRSAKEDIPPPPGPKPSPAQIPAMFRKSANGRLRGAASVTG